LSVNAYLFVFSPADVMFIHIFMRMWLSSPVLFQAWSPVEKSSKIIYSEAQGII
jgi:hypothetical protein